MLGSMLKYRRFAGWLFALLLLGLYSPSIPSVIAGMPFIILGAALRTWASGCIEKNIKVAWSGPYQHLRHPLYVGSFIIGIGVTLMANRWLLLGLFLVLYLTVYLYGVLTEESFMRAKFGRSYGRYCKHVPRFIPRIKPTREQGRGWMSYLVLRHGEYNVWLALVGLYFAAVLSLEYKWGVLYYATGHIFGP